MPNKISFWKVLRTKTAWVGLVSIGFGFHRMFEGDPDGFEEIIIGFGLLFGRHALNK